MRSRELGFTLIEIVIAVGVTLILLAAGGIWMMSMQPGALRGAVNDVDANFAAAQSIAESSGNGATLVFAPQRGGAPGFTLRVYTGRPNAANAVTPTNVMQVSSATALSEAHFGKPPFAVFLNSAGYATGIANYPVLDAQENPTFNVVAQQPACPAGGIQLTFTSPQGATATRTYACNTLVAGTSSGGAGATPTPNPMHVAPTYLLAHDTTDAGPLRFKAVEYGYYHWYASTSNTPNCQTTASDTGAAPATFASPWPYAAASPASQGAAAPAPPAAAPYTWPGGDPNDPPGWFQLAPVLHNGGMCTVTVADDSGQSGSVTVQVMGDLTASATTATLQVGQGNQTINFTKTFDSEKLLLSVGGPCAGIVRVTTASGAFPSAPANTPATASITITPVAAGSCTLIVQDQYGEKVPIGLTVTNAQVVTWPQQLVIGVNGSQVGVTSGSITVASRGNQLNLGPFINALLGGATALASGGQPCYALGVTNSWTSGSGANYIDTSITSQMSLQTGVYVDSNGCEVYNDAQNGYDIAVPPNKIGAIATNTEQTLESYVNDDDSSCGTVNLLWLSNPNAVVAALMGASTASQALCSLTISNGTSSAPQPDAGLVTINAISSVTYCGTSATGPCINLQSTWNPPPIDQQGDNFGGPQTYNGWVAENARGTLGISQGDVPSYDAAPDNSFQAYIPPGAQGYDLLFDPNAAFTTTSTVSNCENLLSSDANSNQNGAGGGAGNTIPGSVSGGASGLLIAPSGDPSAIPIQAYLQGGVYILFVNSQC